MIVKNIDLIREMHDEYLMEASMSRCPDCGRDYGWTEVYICSEDDERCDDGCRQGRAEHGSKWKNCEFRKRWLECSKCGYIKEA